MDKIAFLFLVYDKVVSDKLWSSFFNNADKTKYSIHIHCKKDKLGPFSNYKTIEAVDTEWADISLVKAQTLLLTEALKDETNKMFVFLSQSCIPVKKFDYIYEYLFSSQLSIFNERPLEFPPRYANLKELLKKEIIKAPRIKEIKDIRKAAQWCILNRNHAEILSDKQTFNSYEWYNIFSHIFAPDEIFYFTILMNLKLQDEIRITDDLSYSSTFDNWGPLPKWAEKKFGYGGPKDCKFERPKQNRVKTYQRIEEKELDYLLESRSLFARKFTKHCLITPKNIRLEKYLKNLLTGADNHL